MFDCSFLNVVSFAFNVSTEFAHSLYACDHSAVRPFSDSICLTFANKEEHLLSSAFISFGALFSPLSSARRLAIVSSPLARLRIALSIDSVVC